MDKKKYPRALYRCSVNLWKNAEATRIVSMTKNISNGGVCIVLPQELEPGHEARLEIELDDSEKPLSCYAQVRWTVPSRTPSGTFQYETGFQFTDITDPDRTRIERIVEKHLALK